VIRTGCPCLCPDKFPSQTFTYLDCEVCIAPDDGCDSCILGAELLLPPSCCIPDCACWPTPGVGIIPPVPEETFPWPRPLIMFWFMEIPPCIIAPEWLPWFIPCIGCETPRFEATFDVVWGLKALLGPGLCPVCADPISAPEPAIEVIPCCPVENTVCEGGKDVAIPVDIIFDICIATALCPTDEAAPARAAELMTCRTWERLLSRFTLAPPGGPVRNGGVIPLTTTGLISGAFSALLTISWETGDAEDVWIEGIACVAGRATAGIWGKLGTGAIEVTVLGSTFTVAVGTGPTETGCRFWIGPLADDTGAGGCPVTGIDGATVALSTFTGLWVCGKFVAEWLKAAHASTKFSEIRTR